MNGAGGAPDGRFAAARAVADTVCYEGYVLYPYRASAGKNRLRWQFGVIAPPAYAAGGAEADTAWAEVVVETRPRCRLQVRVRALHVGSRTVEVADGAAPGGYREVDSHDDGANVWTSFDEAVPVEFDVADVDATGGGARRLEVLLPGAVDHEALPAGAGARLVRRRWPVAAAVEVAVAPLDGPFSISRVRLSVTNTTRWDPPPDARRDDAVHRSLVAAHVLVAVDGGRPVSALEPPRFAADAVGRCRHQGLFPVLVGEPGEEVVLASPIILYDHPAVAPESQGDMFDATEIDEILALRVRTLTDEEKRQARATDPRAAAVVERCDAMEAPALEALHGTFRPVGQPNPTGGGGGPASGGIPWWEPAADAACDPWTDTVEVAGVVVGSGTRVRLQPRRRADAQDLFVAGRQATVAGVFHDVSGEVHVAVVVDDPDADLHQWHGRYLYFGPDEVDPVAAPAPAATPRVLVAGVGNVFLGDDGFGVEVARRVDPATVPAGVKVADFGIRGVHLAYELLEGYDTLVLVDAVRRGDPPGTVTVIEHDPGGDGEGGTLAAVDAHGMDPAAVLAMAGDLGATVRRVLVLGCEVEDTSEGMGLSPAVAAAVSPAADALVGLAASLAAGAAGADNDSQEVP